MSSDIEQSTLVCSCGNPGSVLESDPVARCIPCRREYRRQHVEPSHVDAVIARREVGRASGDPVPSRESRRLQVQLDAARSLVDRAVDLLPDALASISLAAVDGYPSKAPGASPSVGVYLVPPEGPCSERGCDEFRPCPDHDEPLQLTTVEAAVVARHRVSDLEAQLDARVKAIAMNAVQFVHLLESAARLGRPPAAVQMCNRGVGREGHLEWQDPLCERHFDETRAGMCDECWQAEAAWREARGLDPRERTVPTAARPICVRDGCVREQTPGRADGLCNAHRVADSRARKANRQ